MTSPTAVERQVRIGAPPVRVAASLAASPWRGALRVEPAGAGSRVVLAARIEPEGLARAVEALAVDDLCRLKASFEHPPTDQPTEIKRNREETKTVSELHLKTIIDAPKERVWAALADFGGVSVWNPSVKQSALTSEATEGVGISRECQLAPMGTVRERVTEWDPGRLMSIEIYENDNLPGFRGGQATLGLTERGPDRTEVTCHMDYSIGLGLLGATMNAVGMRRLFTRSLTQLLAGLKYHVETGRPVDGSVDLPLDAVA